MYLQDTIAIGSQNSKQLGNTQTQRHKCYCTAIAKYAFFLFWQVSSHVLGYRMIASKGQSCATRCFLFEALIDLLDVYKRFSRVHSFKETSINNFLINSFTSALPIMHSFPLHKLPDSDRNFRTGNKGRQNTGNI